MRRLEGKPIAANILADLKEKILNKKATPGLAVILVGSDEASRIYVNLKGKRAQEIGINFYLYDFLANYSQDEIIAKIKEANENPIINGIIVQLPLPETLDTQKIISSIEIIKDVDGFSFGRQLELEPVFPKAIMKMIKGSGIDCQGKKATAIVNSDKFGEVMVEFLKKEGISGEYFLSENIDRKIEKIKEADIVISAVGKPGILKGEFFKKDAIVIDGGISKIEEKVLGDVDTHNLERRDIIIAPVPGGVGPVTIACLLENVYMAYLKQSKE